MRMKYSIGFTCSCFDLLHAGHITMLQEAKSICNHLIVGLQVDPSVDRPEKNKPIQSLMERQIQLNAIKYVDEVIIYHTEDGTKVAARPSGTEPKIKFYFSVKSSLETVENAVKKEQELEAKIDRIITEMDI